MKIAKCKCGGQALLTGENKNIPQCSICTRFAINVDYWNKANTDQYGQQLYEKRLTFTEWDGDVEHLPPEGTNIHLCLKGGLITGRLGSPETGPVLENAALMYGFLPIEKGDQFAVVGEDSHAS